MLQERRAVDGLHRVLDERRRCRAVRRRGYFGLREVISEIHRRRQQQAWQASVLVRNARLRPPRLRLHRASAPHRIHRRAGASLARRS
jgi:hypothetical protein